MYWYNCENESHLHDCETVKSFMKGWKKKSQSIEETPTKTRKETLF